jgi:hypothetical protein
VCVVRMRGGGEVVKGRFIYLSLLPVSQLFALPYITSIITITITTTKIPSIREGVEQEKTLLLVLIMIILLMTTVMSNKKWCTDGLNYLISITATM